MHHLVVLFLIVVSYFVSVYGAKWEDCGIPLTRKIYYQGVTVSPSTINITKDNSVSININAQTKDYTLQPNSMVNLLVTKDGEKYFDGSVGDLCQILYDANRVSCPLQTGPYSFTYQYDLPPLPSGNYSVTITTFEPTTGDQIGCLSVQSFIIGLGADQCSYTSSLSASFVGTAQYLNDNNVIQIGPWGPNGEDLGYSWGTFKSITASPDLVGYTLSHNNYVWGLTGAINSNVSNNTFEGTLVIGYQPNVQDYQHVQLIYQGTFSWNMTPSTATPYIFQSGQFELVPTYTFPAGFAYPLNLGNLGPFSVTKDASGSTFIVTASRKWCRCNCAAGGLGTDGTHIDLSDGSGGKDMSAYKKGTIAVCVIGGIVLMATIALVIKVQKTRPKPVVYEDPDLLDPQKPDYGTMAINEAFEEEDRDFRV